MAADAAQSALLTNQAVAYKARGVEKYNASVSAKDDAAKTADLEAAKSDFKAAAAASAKAAALIKAMEVPTRALNWNATMEIGSPLTALMRRQCVCWSQRWMELKPTPL